MTSSGRRRPLLVNRGRLCRDAARSLIAAVTRLVSVALRVNFSAGDPLSSLMKPTRGEQSGRDEIGGRSSNLKAIEASSGSGAHSTNEEENDRNDNGEELYRDGEESSNRRYNDTIECALPANRTHTNQRGSFMQLLLANSSSVLLSIFNQNYAAFVIRALMTENSKKLSHMNMNQLICHNGSLIDQCYTGIVENFFQR